MAKIVYKHLQEAGVSGADIAEATTALASEIGQFVTKDGSNENANLFELAVSDLLFPPDEDSYMVGDS